MGRPRSRVAGKGKGSLEHGSWILFWQIRKGKGQPLAYRINAPKSAQTGRVELGTLEENFEAGIIKVEIS